MLMTQSHREINCTKYKTIFHLQPLGKLCKVFGQERRDGVAVVRPVDLRLAEPINHNQASLRDAATESPQPLRWKKKL